MPIRIAFAYMRMRIVVRSNVRWVPNKDGGKNNRRQKKRKKKDL